MQRIGWLLVALVPTAGAGQHSAGSGLWRLAATTLPVPQALTTGGAAAFWNPAQGGEGARVLVGLEAIQTSAVVAASGVLAVVRLRAKSLGHLGLVYGRMQLGDLVRTSVSPDPDQGSIPFYTQSVGATWSAVRGRTMLGTTLTLRTTRLDLAHSDRWTFDVGATRTLSAALRVAVATHFFSSFRTDDPAQDVYGGVEYRVWRGRLWKGGTRTAVHLRYGVTFAHGFTSDQQLGAGLQLGDQLASDLLLVREGGYADAGWRAVGGIRVAIGRYRLSFARDAGASDIGAAYRVGLEALLR